MKKRIVLAVAVLMLCVLSFCSCSVLAELGITESATVLSGEYKSINEKSKVIVRFDSESVEVSIGSRSMSGTYTLFTDEDGSQHITFDFADQVLPRCAIRTGTYPISFGTQNGIDYMLLFGARYDKQ